MADSMCVFLLFCFEAFPVMKQCEEVEAAFERNKAGINGREGGTEEGVDLETEMVSDIVNCFCLLVRRRCVVGMVVFLFSSRFFRS